MVLLVSYSAARSSITRTDTWHTCEIVTPWSKAMRSQATNLLMIDTSLCTIYLKACWRRAG